MIIREKKHRLDKNNYIGRVIVSFTVCTEKRQVLFAEEKVVNEFIKILGEVKDKYECKNWVYIFMPDHLHLVLEGISENSDLLEAIKLFKQKAGYWLSANEINIKMQKDFYDHIHRKDEELKKQIFYILNNPVRRRLVDEWEDYPCKGSLDFDLTEIVM